MPRYARLLPLCVLTVALHAATTVDTLRCEYRDNPLGLDVAQPRLSWRLHSDAPGCRQTAWQVRVASTPEPAGAELWDSGKVAGDATSQVPYAGKPLASRTQCWWQVRVWDQTDQPSAWSAPAHWSMGLLKPEDWQAGWIGYDVPSDLAANRPTLGGLKWLRLPGRRAVKGQYTAVFRFPVDLPADRALTSARLVLTADNECEARLNGTVLGQAQRWSSSAVLALKGLRTGPNALAISATNSDFLPAQIVGKLVLEFEPGRFEERALGKAGKVAPAPVDGWDQPGFDDSAWAAPEEGGCPWGTGSLTDIKSAPASYLRRGFTLAKPIARATVFATALGLYELHLNGAKVQGADVLTPGWTDYRKRVYYQTYDVTQALRAGDNVLGAVLGEGWYAGCLAFTGRNHWYGGQPRLLAQLVVDHPDGTTTTIATDDRWKAADGPIRRGDLLLGCLYDARRERAGWDTVGYDDTAWAPVVAQRTAAAAQGVVDVTKLLAAAVKDNKLSLEITNEAMGGDPIYGKVKTLRVSYRADGKAGTATCAENAVLNLAGAGLTIVKAEYGDLSGGGAPAGGPLVQAAPAEPVRRQEELPTVKLTEPKPGCWTFDLGQNMVGWTRLKLRGAAGQRVTLRHGEMLNPDGTVYTANLRSAACTDEFTLKGGAEEVLEPAFTFRGFRYVEVRGLTEKPEPTMLTGVVVHSDMRRTGDFECSSPLVNQLFHNIIWGQKGNYLEAPTDCPQRDERAGWTGDTQFFCRTGSYNFDVAPFFTRWLVTMCEDSQHGDGSFAHVAPDLGLGSGATAWGDAALLCTWNQYHVYGDTRVITDHWAAMERYMVWLAGRSKGFIAKVGGFGDWLNLGGSAAPELMDTAYYAHLAKLMAEMAAATGQTEAAARYAKLRADIQAAFNARFWQPDGTLKGGSQTGYALVFTMDLVPAELRAAAAEKFAGEIRRFKDHLATGFIGTPRLLPGLSAAGRDDMAYKVLLQETYPSWLAQVKYGATTMWERWDGWTPDRGFQSIGMNSFNHYAFGAVGEYLYASVAGIDTDGPGFRRLLIQPRPGEGLTWARASFDSPAGLIKSSWRLDGGRCRLSVTVPPNTTATVRVPADDPTTVATPPGATRAANEPHAAVFTVGAGNFEF